LWSAAERDDVSYAALRRTHAALTVLHACELQLTVTDVERLEAGFETYKPVKSSPDKVSARPETTLCELTAQT